ncbi:NAD dependent epimerase/dehydratase family protein [Lutispora thermophila DSM 19022]|uniref:NAD dependent epimerase/dehydratase family protein n=1 Tax=Lutispora thermophila DSM 19022 TaxID=1122184 RepID=A0A1M6BXZ2_9FIRM|nr:NAD dependent epimerase/dehydratase family protein [Lutispora thermophila DSM 19022]
MYGIKYTILRYANVYGIRQEPKGEGGVISIFLDKMLRGEQPTIFGDGSNTRDYTYVEDIAEANLKALYHGDNEIFNIGTGKATDLNRLFDIMKKLIGFKGDAIYGPFRPGDIKDSCLCNDKAVGSLKWEWKYSIEKGLEKTIKYYKEKYV